MNSLHARSFLRRLILLFGLSISAFGCAENNSEQQKNDRLIGFKCTFLSEMGNDDYHKLESQIGHLEVKYLHDIIYVSQIVEANACADYDGSIETKKNHISLEYQNKRDEVCTSLAIYRMTYIIDNPTEEKAEISGNKD